MLSEFARDLQRTMEKYRMLETADRILVGVSGGADSVALLLALQELGLAVGAAHLHHGLRGEASDADEHFVSALAVRLNIPFFSRRISIAAQPGNIEAAGREARREFFRTVAAEAGFTKVALAHHRNDRVETFILHLLRGAGTEGLVSMAPVSGIVIRPLIEIRREEIERYLQAAGQPWRTDVTNMDTSYARNRLRHRLIPELEKEFNPQLVSSLARTVEVLQDEDRWMRDGAEQWLREFGKTEEATVSVPAEPLALAPVALTRRVIRLGLKYAGSSLKDVTFDHIEGIRSLLLPGRSGKTAQVPGDVVVLREFDRLLFCRTLEAAATFEYELQIPGMISIPELKLRFRAEIVDSCAILRPAEKVFVDGGRLGPYVRIRNWNSGDYYRPVGLSAGKVKKLFQQARIPRSQRSRWPVFVTGSAIVWVASFPVSREFAPSERSQKIVAFEAVRD